MTWFGFLILLGTVTKEILGSSMLALRSYTVWASIGLLTNSLMATPLLKSLSEDCALP